MASSSTLPTPTTFVPNNGQPATRHTPLLTVFQNLINDPLFHKALYLKTPEKSKEPKKSTGPKESTGPTESEFVNKNLAHWKSTLKTKLIAWDSKFGTSWPKHGNDLVPSKGDELTANDLIAYFVLDKNDTFNFKNYDGATNNWKVAAEQVVEKVRGIDRSADSLISKLTANEFIIYCLNEFGLYTILTDDVDRRTQPIDLLTEEVLNLPVLKLESEHTPEDKTNLLAAELSIRNAKLLVTPAVDPDDLVSNKLAEAIQAFLKKSGNELAGGQFQTLNEVLSGMKPSTNPEKQRFVGLKEGLKKAKKKGSVSRAKLLQDSGDLFERSGSGEDLAAVGRALVLINEAVGSMDAAKPTVSTHSTRSGVAGRGGDISDDANSREDKGKEPESFAIVPTKPNSDSSAVSETDEDVSDTAVNNDGAAANDLLALPAPLEAMDLKELQYLMKARGFTFGNAPKAVLVERLAKIWNQVPDLNELTVVELKYLLGMRKLEMTGLKADLVKRLENNSQLGYGT